VTLYRPEAFEPLTDQPWDEERVRAAIRAIVADAEANLDNEALWPPVEDWDAAGGTAPLPLTTLYRGASGVAHGLDVLRRRGIAETRLDLATIARRAYEIWRGNPAPERLEPPFRTHATPACARTGTNETNELMNGSPGTMIAARVMLDRTGDERWAEAWRESADELWRRRYFDGFWSYPPYRKGIGASHGIATNTNVLLAGGRLFPEERREPLVTGTSEALARTAVTEDGLANWPMAAEDCGELEWQGEIRLQWCHGGAGVVASAAAYLDEELLLAGAELVWRAGPQSMEKGPGICHGTAGNGYALLKTFERTGDDRWLERARRFAVHALDQVERWREQRGRGRYSLWAGDVGAALFAADCLDARTDIPIVDTWG
jgi:Lanthionine synthetase C-like protein